MPNELLKIENLEIVYKTDMETCLLYTSDAADE